MKTPDITPAQILAKLTLIVGQLVAWGLLSGHTEKLIVSIATTVFPVVWILADAIIRHGRASGSGSTTVAELVQLAKLVEPTAAAPH